MLLGLELGLGLVRIRIRIRISHFSSDIYESNGHFFDCRRCGNDTFPLTLPTSTSNVFKFSLSKKRPFLHKPLFNYFGVSKRAIIIAHAILNNLSPLISFVSLAFLQSCYSLITLLYAHTSVRASRSILHPLSSSSS